MTATAVAARPRTRFTPRAAILAVLTVALLFYLLVPLKTYMAQRSRLDQLTRRMEQIQQQNADLEARIRRLHDPRHLEERARQCLGMVKPGEISFIVVPKGSSPTPPSC